MPYDVSENDVGEDGLYGGLPDTAVVPVDSSQGDQGGVPVVPVAPVSSTQNVQAASTDPLAHAYDNATYNIFNPAGWTPSASDLGTLAFDPAIFEGTLQMQGSTRGGGGLQGAQFAGGVDPKIATSVQSDPYYAIQKNLSDLLKSNQFDKAVSYAQENNVLDYLTTPSALKNLREPFTANEAASFLQSMSKVDPGADHKYNPETALSASMSQWDSSTGYPGYGGGVYRPNTTFDNIMDNLVAGALYGTAYGIASPIGAALGSALGATGAAEAAATAGQTAVGGLSGIPSAALNAAAKSAIGNAVVTAAQGGDFGDVLKAAAQGAITAGAGAAVASTFAPALQGALVDAGIDPNIAKSASTAAISAGQAAVAGQDPLQAAFISGLGTYAQLQGNQVINDFAESTGISTELAKQLVGPAGAAIASSIVGGDALHAAVNQLVNQNYDKVLDYGKEKLNEFFPPDSNVGQVLQAIKDVKGEFDSLVKQGEGVLKDLLPDFSKSGSTGLAATPAAKPSIDDLQDVTVSATRLPVTPVNLIQQPSEPSSAAVTPEPAGALPQTIEPPAPPETVEVTTGREQEVPVVLSPPSDVIKPSSGLADVIPESPDQLQTVNVTAQKVPETPVALTALERPQEPTSPLAAVTEPVEAAPPQQPLEEVQVTAQKQPDVPVLVSSGALPAVIEEPTSPLEEVAVTTKREPQKEPEVPANVIPVGNLPTVGSDGMEEVAVTGSRYTQPPINLALNDFKPTVEQPDVSFQPPFNLNIETGKTGGLGMLASGAAPEQFPWLDTSDQFLKAKPTTAQGAKLAQLQQIFSQLDPNLRDVLADKGYTPAAMGGSIRSYAEGSSVTCCFKAVLKDLAPNFVPCTQEMLAPLASRRQRTDVLAKLNQIKPMIMGGAQGYAKGGLPSQYAEAAPEGHNPEFITGLTGYYAQGGGTGQSDDIPAMLHDGDYVMDADTVAAFGDGSSKAGAQVLDGLRKQVPYRNVKQGKAVPAKIADGEYVFPADFVTALGQGDNKRGAKMLDAMRERLRAHKRSAPTSKIPPKAKSPMDYMRGKG